MKCDSEYVLGIYGKELVDFHRRSDRPWTSSQVKEGYSEANVARWHYERLKEWSASSDRGKASPHAFRKTILQLAREGQDLNHQVAKNAAVTETVMLTHYIEEHAEQYWHASNRTFQRILAAADPEVLRRYGYESSESERLKSQVAKGIDQGDWKAVESAAKKLRCLDRQKSER